jgi:hypothetical protein
VAISIITTAPGAIATYGDLLDAITEETDGRADDGRLARFVRSAESYINAFLRANPVRPMMNRAPITVDAEFVAAPSDMIRPFGVELNDGERTCEVKFADTVDLTAWQSLPRCDGAPKRFTMHGGELRFWPVPAASYPANLFYYQTLPHLKDAGQSNWLLDEFPNVYLEGGLYYAYRDMPDIEKASALKELFDQSLASVADAYPKPANMTQLGHDSAMIPRNYDGPFYGPTLA